VGSSLSVMERLSISSYLAHGHTYHLYVYETPTSVPEGAVLKDAGEILPRSAVFEYKSHASVAGFANFFRYKLLLERGQWWADLDTVCLKPFEFDDDYVFASEQDGAAVVVSNGFIKAPAGAEVMQWACDECRKKDPQKLVWGETGPALFGTAVRHFALDSCVKPAHFFNPFSFRDWEQLLDPASDCQVPGDAYAIHLWNEMWRRNGRDKTASYPAACLFERLKRTYL
jgi:mannosyltransferase OCH1-like enzyme